MNYPESLKIGDTIGICAPSDGVVEEKIERLNLAIENLKKVGYKVIETKNVRTSIKGRSSDAKTRAEEFMQLWENEEVKLIIYASGGDFLMEMLDELDFEKIRKSNPKWTIGFSDITTLSFLLNTLCDIPSIYCENVKEYSMTPLYRNLEDSLKIASGEDIVQASFERHQKRDCELDDNTYHLTEKTVWKNITHQEEISITGRALGGCLDCIDSLIGTKYDKITNYIDKYKDDGIIWFLECCEMNTPQLTRILWKMKNANMFKNCKRNYIW